MTKTPVYCDYNAGAPIRAEAAVALSRALAAGGNASSVHSVGRRMRAMIEDGRERIAGALGASAENVVFTSGATEALHLALTCSNTPSLIISAVEHDAVFDHAARAMRADAIAPVSADGLIDLGPLETRAMRADAIAPVSADGLIDLGPLETLLAQAPKPTLVAVQLANNETGVIQPVGQVAALCRQYGALLLVDAAQAFGRIPVSISDLDATYLVASSHKLGGPPGAGALALAPGAPFRSTRFGGGQERGRRPGTENGAAVVGFAVAVEWALKDREAEAKRVSAIRGQFEAGLPEDAVIFGASVPRLPNTSNFALPGLNAETVVIAMDLEGVAVSSGAACSSGKVRSSRVLAAMGVAPELAKAAIRVSFGHESKASDADEALSALHKIAARRTEGAAA